MNKLDGNFAKIKTDWHRDPRCRALKHPSYKWLNQVLWNLCVKERRDRLPSYYTAATLAHEADIDVRTVRKGLTLMSQECIGLITINSDETITVHGVREIHENKKFCFLGDEQLPLPPREEKSRVEKKREEQQQSPKSASDSGEIESQALDLDSAVVAILKNLGVDQSFWPKLHGMSSERVRALSELAKKKSGANPAGWFRKAVEGSWDVPGVDKKAFEMQCDLIRRTATHLKSKRTGQKYEILKFKTGAKIVINATDRGDVNIDEKGLNEFTWELEKP